MIKGQIYYNGDDCFLAWTFPFTENCWGFAIYRKLTTASGKKFEGYLLNRTGFEGDNNPPNSTRPCTEWPFQRYTWTDHGVSGGDVVSYSICPVMKAVDGLAVDESQQCRLGPVTLSPSGDGKVSAFFNRGILLSQFVAKKLGDDWTKTDLLKLKNSLKKDDNELRRFLSGPLGAQLISLLKTANEKKWHIYAALYELDDDTLIGGLVSLGKKAHVVLSNGSAKKKGEDGNKNAAAELDGVIDLHRRMLWSEGLGHNKFVVFAKSKTEPFMVWTGSTNWATTGLCTQINNGILIEDTKLAKAYLEHWNLLKDDHRVGRGGAAMHFGEKLMASNDEPKSGGGGSTGKSTVWFTRTSEGQEMEAVSELINSAKKAILFLMFEPGNNGLLQVIQARLSSASPTYDKDLYLHGVANTLVPAKTGQGVHIDLVGDGQHDAVDLKVVQPEGIADGLAGWLGEVTRKDFLMSQSATSDHRGWEKGQKGVVGHAIIHSKMIVIDPFTNPTVITGSHNFSQSASTKNDENLLIVRGNKGLAQRYAVNIMSVYQHFRWRAYVQRCLQMHKSPWQGLKKSDAWQLADASQDAELRFWA